MRFNKRGAELSLNVIILAALGILVLLILVAVFSGQLGKSNQKISEATEGVKQINAILQGAGISMVELKDKCSSNTDKCNDYLNEKNVDGHLVAEKNNIPGKCIEIKSSDVYVCLR
ncbi:MAG: hypothetical protein QW210_03645 [Candidatus Woesearchaeota archaeon]